MLEKKTPISLLRWSLKKRITATKRSSDSCRIVAIGDTPFLSSETQRYWRTAQTNFSPERKVAPSSG